MTDDLEPLRRARPDRLLPDDPPDPEILAREKARLMSAITGQDGAVVHRRTPAIYPRLAYRDEVAALDFLTRAFGLGKCPDGVQDPGPPGAGVSRRHCALRRILVQQPSGGDPGHGPEPPRLAPVVLGHHVGGDAVQPGPGRVPVLLKG